MKKSTDLMKMLVMCTAIVGSPAIAAESAALMREHSPCGGSGSTCEALEVLSLGLTYDKYRQGKVWDALKLGTAFSPLRAHDPATVPWSVEDKYGQSGRRAVDAFVNAVAHTPMYWGVPSMYAGIPLSTTRPREAAGPILGLTGSAEGVGYSWHLFVASDWLLSNSPDQLFEMAFQFFDKHADVPLLFVSAVDTPDDHDLNSPPHEPRLLRNGRYFIELPDSAVVLVLGRCERVDRLRRFAWDDKENEVGQTKIRLAYYDLRDRLAKPDLHDMRDLTVEEWTAETARLAARADIRSAWGTSKLRSEWKPTPWFPVPWSKAQLEAFDRLPTLGYVHRPIYVTWPEAQSDAKNPDERRVQVFKEAMDKAGQAISRSPTPAFPTRIVSATGGSTDKALILHGALNAQKAAGGPGYDINDKTRFIDTDRRLGNTGVATFFMQVAIGVMGSYRDGGVSAAINMRDVHGASIMFISPPSDELRAKQKHPAGGDVFRHKVEPAYDPEVYRE